MYFYYIFKNIYTPALKKKNYLKKIMQSLDSALQKGPWYMLHNVSFLNIIINHVRQLAEKAVAESQISTEDVHGKPDDVEFTIDVRDNNLAATLHEIEKSESIWPKQYIVLYSLWQYPGLLTKTKVYASQSVCWFLDTQFISIMNKYVHGQNISTKEKGSKTEILDSALSPLECVQYVIKFLQLAHYHKGQ